MTKNEIDRINAAIYLDDLDHKVRVYDGVKHTLQLCKTMIQALDATSDSEKHARAQLISYIELARNYAQMSACDVEVEGRGLPK